MRFSFRAFAADLNVKTRIKFISYSIAYLRIWSLVGGNYVSPNAKHSMELNFHGLLAFYIKCRDEIGLQYFIPQLLNSQTVEHTSGIHFDC